MNTEDFLKIKEHKYEVNIGISIITLIEIVNKNQIYLRSILKRQLEIKELLKGKTESEFDETVNEKLVDLEKKIYDVANADYHTILAQILK